MIKKTIFLLLFVINLMAGPVYVSYGAQAQAELDIHYIDNQKEGFIKLKGQKSQVFKTESVAFGKSNYLHSISLSRLKAGELVEFSCGSQEKIYKVRTLKDGACSFCVLGDLYRELAGFKEGIRAVAKENPDFVVFGGDLAYTTHGPVSKLGGETIIRRYLTYLNTIAQNFIKPDGQIIPFITVIGNHDYKKDVDEWAYKLFFPKNAKSYLHYDMGDLFDLIILDTGHMAPMNGLQLGFLKQALKSSKKYKIAAYHVGAYPSVYDYESPHAKNVRENFCPEFDQGGVCLAFEHHSHAFKITHPLKNNQIDEAGTIYCGDGCVGVKPRAAKNDNAWYIKAAGAKRNYFKVELSDQKIRVYPRDFKLQEIADPFEIKPR